MKMHFGMAALASAAALVSAVPTKRTPGTVVDAKRDGWVYTKDNTLTSKISHDAIVPQSASADYLPLQFSITNNYPGGDLKAYVSGLDSNGAAVMLSPNSSWYYPPAGSTTETTYLDDSLVGIPLNPQGEKTEFTLPDYVFSGRFWVSEGALSFGTNTDESGVVTMVFPAPNNDVDPSAEVNWGFTEMSNVPDSGIYANLSQVDFVGLVMGMRLTLQDGTTSEVPGLPADALQSIYTDLQNQAASDGWPWDKLCLTSKSTGDLIRCLAPLKYADLDANSFNGYYASYVDEVYSSFESGNQTLTVDPQNGSDPVACSVSGDVMTCGSETFDKPGDMDILGCDSGPFANEGSDERLALIPRLCAAFHRSTFFVEGGEMQPGPSADTYYGSDPTVHYSRIIHSYEADNQGYTFAYDDVNPEGENNAGVLAGPNPTLLEITVGGPLDG